jgi:hypothetical protein
MSNLQLLVNIGAYSDSNPSNAPAMQNFKWSRAINALSVSNAQSEQVQVAVSTTSTILTSANPKRIIYLETDAPVTISINGGAPIQVKPLIQTGGNFPGMYLSTEGVTSLSITNPSSTIPVNILVLSAE